LITSGYFTPGNNSLSWSAPSTVTLIQDGRCSIIVNSGLPIQKNDLVSSKIICSRLPEKCWIS
jgi:hypothetical protein